MNIKRFLTFIFVLQEVSNKDRNPKLGRGFTKARRINPYNPISYLILLAFLIIGILMFGFVGLWKEIDYTNPLKWQ